jgi:hypothetical protein
VSAGNVRLGQGGPVVGTFTTEDDGDEVVATIEITDPRVAEMLAGPVGELSIGGPEVERYWPEGWRRL